MHPFFGVRIVRFAEIEVVPEYLEAYLTYAKEVGETSVKVEPGVLTLFSMQTKEDPCKIYILEITGEFSIYGHEVRGGKAKVEKWLKGLR